MAGVLASRDKEGGLANPAVGVSTKKIMRLCDADCVPLEQSFFLLFLHTFRSALCAVRLHGNMRIQMVKRAICLFTAIPSALVHALNLLITPARPLVLLSARNRDE